MWLPQNFWDEIVTGVVVGVLLISIGGVLTLSKKALSVKPKLIFTLQNQELKPRLYFATVVLENEGKETAKYVNFKIHTDLKADGYITKVTQSGTVDFKVQGVQGSFIPVFVSNLLPGQKAIVYLNVANSGEIKIEDVKTDSKYEVRPIMTITTGEVEINPEYING